MGRTCLRQTRPTYILPSGKQSCPPDIIPKIHPCYVKTPEFLLISRADTPDFLQEIFDNNMLRAIIY